MSLNEKLPHADLENGEESGKVLRFPIKDSTVTAGYGIRILSYVIDMCAITLLRRAVTMTALLITKSIFLNIPPQEQVAIVYKLQFLDLFIGPFIFLSYFFLSFASGEGKTIGMILCKLSAVNTEEKDRTRYPDMNIKSAILRSCTYFTCMLFLAIPFLAAFFRKDKKGLPDLISHSFICYDSDFYKYQPGVVDKSETQEEYKEAA